MEPSGTAHRFEQQLRCRISGEQERGGVVGADVPQDALVGGQVQLVPGERGGLDQQTKEGGVLQSEEGMKQVAGRKGGSECDFFSPRERTYLLTHDLVLLGQKNKHVKQIEQHRTGLLQRVGATRIQSRRRGRLKVVTQDAEPVHVTEHLPKKEEAALGASSLHLVAQGGKSTRERERKKN